MELAKNPSSTWIEPRKREGKDGIPKGILSPSSPPGSFLTSLALHGLMAASVVALMNTGLFQEEEAPVYMDLGYEVLDEPPAQVKEAKPIARAKAPEAPVKTQAPVAATQELQDEQSDIKGTQAAAKPAESTGAQGNGSAEAVPYYKIKPKYPQAALVSGEEGWVLMKIDVTETGEVENIRVVDGEKRNLFQDEARRAVAKWKYRPFTDPSGNPVRKADHPVRVDFKLQDA